MNRSFEAMKYGFFIHFIINNSVFPDGRRPATPDESVDRFDVTRFADGVAAMRPDYIILTAWHWQARPLYPSAVSKEWRPGSTPRRDLLGEIIDAVNRRGIAVILYTHPRDGHDFTPQEQKATGWGARTSGNPADPTPDPEAFDYETWNRYTQALYRELIDRYGSRIAGVYTDGGGPCFSIPGVNDKNGPAYGPNDRRRVVDYHALRRIITEGGTKRFMIQNYFGDEFVNDYIMPEAYFGYEAEHFHEFDLFPANQKALAFCPFKSGWAAGEAMGRNEALISAEDIARFTLFNASCTRAGGTCWAAGPYCTGEWDPLVTDTMARAGRLIAGHAETSLRATASPSHPTVSGDCLRKLDYQFFTTSPDGRLEYLHLMKETSRVSVPASEDGAILVSPQPLCAGVRVENYTFAEDGSAELTLSGAFDPIDTVIRFERRNNPAACEAEWINETDHRVYFTGNWHQEHLVRGKDDPHGSFENDYHTARRAGCSAFLAFTGDFVEVYGLTRPGSGRAEIYVDRICQGTVDEDAPHANRVRLFRSGNLCGGRHIIEIVLTEDKPFSLDAFRIIRRTAVQ